MTPSEFRKKKVLSVGELSAVLKEVIQSELFMNIRVQGEIVSRQVKGGNVYLSLIDAGNENLPSNKKATLRAIIFSYYVRNITTEYKEGDEVILTGDLSYYAPFGNISLVARDLEPVGEGNELLKLKRLEEKLEKEGLFDQSRKRPLPKNIKKIAIITSASGAAYHDIMETLSRKVPVNTVLFDAIVQGENAPLSLVKALDKAYKSDADVIIFGRGGGSKTDLSCFNDERVVRKLAESPVPVVTGIGHEIDRSLCDLAADVYCITPTAAADAVLPDLQDVLNHLAEQEASLEKALRNYLMDKELLLSSYSDILLKHSPERELASLSTLLSEKGNRLKLALFNYFHKAEMQLTSKEGSLKSLNPLLNLKGGTAVLRKNGKRVTSVKDLNINDEFEIGLEDGLIKSRVVGKEEYHYGGKEN